MAKRSLLLPILVLGLALPLGACHNSSPSPSGDMQAASGTVRLTVSASSTIANIDHLLITVEGSGAKTTIQVTATGSIPPNLTLDLKVLVAGAVTVTVQALDAANKLLGAGSGNAQVVINQSVDLTVLLQPA
jgi:hypothetical protein